jgi:predicted metal-dependent hydrolase
MARKVGLLMRFLIRLSNGQEYSPVDRGRLTAIAYDAVRALGGDIGNLRISSSAVELDLLIPSRTNLDKTVRALDSKIGSVLLVRQLDVEIIRMESAEAVKLGLALFNEERYWESHEALEAAWRQANGAEKEILQGIILAAAALVHLQKNEKDVALSVMKRAYDKLAQYQGKRFGINISNLKETIHEMLVSGHLDFFKITTGHQTSSATR